MKVSDSTKKPKKIQHWCKIQKIKVSSVDFCRPFLSLFQSSLTLKGKKSNAKEIDFRKAFYEIDFLQKKTKLYIKIKFNQKIFFCVFDTITKLFLYE